MTLAKVARQNDKYQCSLALRPWIYQWVRNIGELSGTEECGTFLTAAYLFGIPELLKEASISVIRSVPANFEAAWADYEIISFLPRHVIGRYSNRNLKSRH